MGRGGLLMVPPGSIEQSLFECCFAGLLQGTPMADVKKGMMGDGINMVEAMERKQER